MVDRDGNYVVLIASTSADSDPRTQLSTAAHAPRPPSPPLPLLQIARQKKKERKAREQLFDVEEDEEDEQEGRSERESSKRHAKGRRGAGADSDSEDEDKGTGVWADNEAEAMLGPGDEAKVSFFWRPCVCLNPLRTTLILFETSYLELL